MEKENLMEKVNRLPLWQKITIGLFILAAIIALVISFNKPSKTEKAVLYQNLDASEAKTIEKEISKMGLESTLSEESTTISVDKDKVAQIKAELATIGLPNSGDPGFELIQESSITDTNYDKQKKYERALVGDIQQGLVQGFTFIEKAVVQLNYTEDDSIFTEDEQESKASATIDTVNNKELTDEQVQAVKNFIASSVKNLTTENVSIMDKNGITYDSNTSSNVSGAYSKQLEILDQTEKRINDDITKMLIKNFGKDNVSTIVRADVNFDEIVQNIEKYDPTGTLVSRQSSKESTIKRDTDAATVIGTEANGSVPDYDLTTGNNNNITAQQEKEDIIENFEVGKTVETIKKNPELSNIQVTVTINQDLNVQNDQNFIQEWQEIIANAAGIQMNAQGGFENGNVKVSVQPFSTINTNELVDEDALKADEEAKALEASKEKALWFWVIVGIALLLVGIFAWFMYKRREEIVVTQAGDDYMEIGEEPIIDENKEKAEMLMNQIDRSKRTKKWGFEDFNEEQKDLANEYKRIAEENPEVAKEYIKKLISEG